MIIFSWFLAAQGKTINIFEYIKEQKKLICISSINILNFMLIESFVHELSVFKVEKNIM